MNKFIAAAKAKRETVLAETAGSGSKMAGPGRFEVKMVSAEIGDNRAKTAKQSKLVYEVTRVIKGDDSNVGATITEYISQNHNAEAMAKRYTILVNQLLDAGVAESKIADDDDETLWDAVLTATQAAAKAITKGVEISAAVDHVETQKLAENGKPYYNNYFIELKTADAVAPDVNDGPADLQDDGQAAVANPAPAPAPAPAPEAPKKVPSKLKPKAAEAAADNVPLPF